MKWVRGLPLTVLIMVLFALPVSAQKVLKFSSPWEPSHPGAISAAYMADRLSALTGGELKTEVYNSRQLGDIKDSIENVRSGSIAFAGISSAYLSPIYPPIDMFSLPYIFKNKQHFWYVFNHPRIAEFIKPLEKKGVKVISWITSGARSLFTKDVPVRSPADLAGQKIRVMPSPVMINTMKAMGANGVPVAWGELYNALQTKVVDGAENNPPAVLSMKFYEVSNYFTLDEHMRIPDAFIMSTKVYNRLSKAQQEAIDRVGLEAQAHMIGAWAVSEQKSLEELKKLFDDVIFPDKAPFMSKVADLVRSEGKRLGVEETLEWILETGKNY